MRQQSLGRGMDLHVRVKWHPKIGWRADGKRKLKIIIHWNYLEELYFYNIYV